jgi:hypothetical protein
LITMPPKRKASSPPKVEKQGKKGNQNVKECVPVLTEVEGVKNTNYQSEIIYDKSNGKTAFCRFKKETTSPELVDKNNDIKPAAFPNFALNHYLQQKSKTSLHGSLKWKVFLFPPFSQLTSFAKTTTHYFGLDLVDEDKERTHWTHKADVWKNLFEGVIEMAKIGQTERIDDAFDGILSSPVRAAPNGLNEIETFKSAKNKNIQHWIMLVPMPTDVDYSEYIPLFLSKFQDLYKQPYIQLAYKSGVEGIITNTTLLTQVSEDGNYWTILDNANEKEIIFKTSHSLSEVLTDYYIKEVVSTMFGVGKDPEAWTGAVKAYAFGH